jgi:hypothetical protein
MTEHTVNMGGTALAEPPAPVLPPGVDDSADAGNRRKLMLVGAGLAVVVVLVAAFFLLKGGSSTPAASTPPVTFHSQSHGNGGGSQTSGHVAKPLKLPKAFKGHVGRDPFKALYVAPSPAAANPASTDGSHDATGNAGSAGATDGTGTQTPTTTPTTTTTQSLGHPVWVELVKVNGTKSATFVVGYSNGKRLTTRNYRDVVAPKGATGTVFAKQFTLLSIQNGEVTFQFGDGTPMDMAPGAANRVTVS